MAEKGIQGAQTPDSSSSDFNAHNFLIHQAMGRIGTSTIVKVLAVTNSGGLTAAGTVDVQPLVNQIDGAGNAIPHGTIHGLPYSRMHGGNNAVIMDPQVNDLGIVTFASRDISSVIANRAAANPGSFRRHDMADGMYVGAILNGIPSQFIQFQSSGMTLTSPFKVTINAPDIALVGNVATTGTLKNNGHDVGSTHEHTLTQPGAGLSGVPV